MFAKACLSPYFPHSFCYYELIPRKHHVTPVSDSLVLQVDQTCKLPQFKWMLSLSAQQPSQCQSPLLQTVGRATIAAYTTSLTPTHSPSCMCLSKTCVTATQHAKGYFGLFHNTVEVPDGMNKNSGKQCSRVWWVKHCHLSYQRSHTRRW